MSMPVIELLSTFFTYFLHPFKKHEAIMQGEEKAMDLYTSLGLSWIFVVFNGMIRVFFILLIIRAFLAFENDSNNVLSQLLFEKGEYTGFYFLILTTVLDVIFYPILTLFFIEFWMFIIKFYAKLMGESEIDTKATNVMSLSLSSNIMLVIPLFGEIAQKISSMAIIYAGMRKQLNFSTGLCIVVLMTPVLFLLMFLSVLMGLVAIA